jgi:hypothetical protein
MHHPSATLTIWLDPGDPTKFSTFRLGGMLPLTVDRQHLVSEIEAAAHVADQAGMSTLRVSTDELEFRHPQFTLLAGIMRSSDLSVALKRPPRDVEGECALVLPFAARAKDWVFALCGAIQGVPERDGEVIRFRPGKVKRSDLRVIPADQRALALPEHVDSFTKQLERTEGIAEVYRPDQQTIVPSSLDDEEHVVDDASAL